MSQVLRTLCKLEEYVWQQHAMETLKMNPEFSNNNVHLLEHSTFPQAEVRMFMAFSLTVCKWKAGLRIYNH